MKQEEIIEELNRIKGEIDRLEKELNKPSEDVIYVPKGIINSRLEIINNNHLLGYSCDGSWYVRHTLDASKKSSTEKQFKLVPCKREELEAGDIAFKSDRDNPDFTWVSCYCIILDEGYQFWSGKDCCFNDANWKYWYKVVKA